jgi:anaerobic magnesium-protoporphyrin IX monomethyl ester cyclase
VIDIDYSFIDPSAYDMKESWSPFIHDGKKNQFFLLTSRGCPYSCSFCGSNKIHGKRMRYASVDAIMSHVRRLVDEYGMNVLTIYDDQLLIDMPRAKELFRRLAPFKLRIECPNGFSVRFIDKEMAYLMKAAGMETVYLAIESGSQYVLDELIHKPLKLSEVKPVVEWLHEAGLFIFGFFVMGLPGESSEHRKETFEFIRMIDIDWAGLAMAMPLRGSQLYEDCVKNNWIPKKEIGHAYSKEYVINIPGIDSAKIGEEVYAFNLWYNFHMNRRMRIGDYKTAAGCFTEILERWPDHALARNYLTICQERMQDD